MRRKRNTFIAHPEPQKNMSRKERPPSGVTAAPPADLLDAVRWWQSRPDGRERFRWVLRDSLDQMFDGERTGRWCYQHLSKTEKTHLGTVVEITLGKEFEVPDGVDLDWRIPGTASDLDCKFSKDLGGWEIPMEMYECDDHAERSGKENHAALLVWVDDDASQWAAGIVRATDDRLRWKVRDGVRSRVYNRDNKRHLSDTGLAAVHWLWGGLQDDLPENVLRHLQPAVRDAIFDEKLSGQERVNELFKRVPGRLLSRHVINTVGQQDDAPKRARDARQLDRGIREDGFLVLGHQGAHPQIADRLGLPKPDKGEWISVRVTSVSASSARPKVRLDGGYWAAAEHDEVIVTAPALPKGRLDEDG